MRKQWLPVWGFVLWRILQIFLANDDWKYDRAFSRILGRRGLASISCRYASLVVPVIMGIRIRTVNINA